MLQSVWNPSLNHPELFSVASELQHCLVLRPLQLSLSHMQNSRRSYKKLT